MEAFTCSPQSLAELRAWPMLPLKRQRPMAVHDLDRYARGWICRSSSCPLRRVAQTRDRRPCFKALLYRPVASPPSAAPIVRADLLQCSALVPQTPACRSEVRAGNAQRWAGPSRCVVYQAFLRSVLLVGWGFGADPRMPQNTLSTLAPAPWLALSDMLSLLDRGVGPDWPATLPLRLPMTETGL